MQKEEKRTAFLLNLCQFQIALYVTVQFSYVYIELLFAYSSRSSSIPLRPLWHSSRIWPWDRPHLGIMLVWNGRGKSLKLHVFVTFLLVSRWTWPFSAEGNCGCSSYFSSYILKTELQGTNKRLRGHTPPPAPPSLWMSITIGTHAASNRPSPPSIIFPSHPQNYSYHIRPEVLIPSLLEYMRLCQAKLTICRHCRPALQLFFPSTFMSDKATWYYRQQIFPLF